MISIANENGALLRVFPTPEGKVLGYHRLFGFISEEAAQDRARNRKAHGLSLNGDQWLCRFDVQPGEKGAYVFGKNLGCEIKAASKGTWNLNTNFGKFQMVQEAEVDPERLGISEEEKEERKPWWLLIGALPFLLLFVKNTPMEPPVEPTILPPPVTVKVQPARQHTVSVPMDHAPEQVQKAQETRLQSKVANAKKAGGAAVAQNLGFLSLLGKKNLSKALGGAPTKLTDASAGAGAGGKEGSGGELLVGLGEGVKRTTVGNTGVSGLGGIGTHGPGGGKGGMGNGLVGSGGSGNMLNGIGDGRKLSSQKLSDDIVLEGGLDRAVIQATIAKYLNQVRACYEARLRINPGLVGQVTMKFEVGPGGTLNYSKVARSSLGDPEVGSCIADKMMSWQFPKPVGGVNVRVSYPFLLRPVNS